MTARTLSADLGGDRKWRATRKRRAASAVTFTLLKVTLVAELRGSGHTSRSSVVGMEEARAVLERLERIEETSDRDELIAELRELVREVEAWVRAEGAMIPV
jgi:hypothetical protein